MMAFNADRELRDLPPLDGGGYGHAQPPESGSELKGYLALLWRRKWIILAFVILVPLVVHLTTGGTSHQYEGTAQVLLSRQSEGLSGLSDPLLLDPARTVRTQADIARLPVIASQVVKAAKLDMSPGTFLGSSSVASDDQIDLLTFHARNANPDRATLLTNLYAQKYIEYSRQLDTSALDRASSLVSRQLAALRKQGLANSGGYAALIAKQQELQTSAALQRSNAVLVRQATGASFIGSSSRRTDLLAVAAGIIIALGVAFLVDAFDTRVRSSEELADELGLVLLGGLYEPRKLGRRDGVLMLEDPNSTDAEPYRILRSTLDVSPFLTQGHVLMVTSAFEAEGKSTTAANLAVAMARAGRHVVLVDLDLRNPSQKKLFNLPEGPGVTEIVLGEAALGDALTAIPFTPRPRGSIRVMENLAFARGQSAPSNGVAAPGGELEVVRSGKTTPAVSEMIGTPVLDSVLGRFKETADLVIVDGPPLLLSADALTLSSKVDSLLLVARTNSLRREYIGRLKRALAVTPALKLGLVVIGDSSLSARVYRQSASTPEAARQPVR
jgi:non-specific protein-tyrosine kinase